MKAKSILGFSASIIVLIIGILWFSGLWGHLYFWSFFKLNEPRGEFDASNAVEAPDYRLEQNWASLPTKMDAADLVPEGIEVPPQGDHEADVFFIHPTGFLTSSSWTSPMDPNSGTEENTEFMMANMASAFNGCCDVYAPRYREANIFAYFGDLKRRDELLNFAYQDVKRAFEHYLQHNNAGRPFILASHSQGTHHAMRLLEEIIDPSEIHLRMIAAYTLGAVLIPLSPGWFAKMQNVGPCQRTNDLHCVVHWDTMPDGSAPIERPAPSLCTNPLNWTVNEEQVNRSRNIGAVIPEGTYNLAMGHQPDIRSGDNFSALGTPIPNLVDARCQNGSLFVTKQDTGPFKVMAHLMVESYHGLDYALFYMDIHENAKTRATTYLTQDKLEQR